MTGVWATVAIGVQVEEDADTPVVAVRWHGCTHRVDFDPCIAPATTSSSGGMSFPVICVMSNYWQKDLLTITTTILKFLEG